jgi:hypothetical protein
MLAIDDKGRSMTQKKTGKTHFKILLCRFLHFGQIRALLTLMNSWSHAMHTVRSFVMRMPFSFATRIVSKHASQ